MTEPTMAPARGPEGEKTIRYVGGHVLNLQETQWRCLLCHQWFDSANYARDVPCDDRIAYSRAEAAQMTGYSEYQIGAAVRSGDLRESYPVVNGRPLKKGRILREDLLAWMRGGESS